MTNIHLSTILAEWFPIAKVSDKDVFYFPICLIGTQIPSSHVKPGYTQRHEEWKVVGEISMNTILLAESRNDLKWLRMQVKEESAKAGLHLNIMKTKSMTTEQICSNEDWNC